SFAFFSELLASHDGERRCLPHAKAKLLVEPDRPGVGAQDVQEHAFRAPVDTRYQRAHEAGGESLPAMVRLYADGADLGPAVQTKPLAGHRDEHTAAPDTQIVAELDRPGQERSGLGFGDEREHLWYIGGGERCRLRAIAPGDPLLLDHL